MESLGRYQIIEEIGRGAMGIVYRGRDPKIDREVALKCLRPHILEAHEGAGRRFQQEILALGRLIHPNIVSIFDVWEDTASGLTYIVMEYVEGVSLAQLLKEKTPLTIEQVVRIGAQICSGLDFAHSKEVIHRDIKPGNILLTQDYRVAKITDFGIARLDNMGMTQTDHLTGTPQYMSPEQCRGEHLDGRCDLFAVGVLLYEVLCRTKAFQGDSLTGIMHQVLTHTPYPPHVISERVPEAVSAVVMQALEKDPADRFESGLALADALVTAIEETSGDFSMTESLTEEMPETGFFETPRAAAQTYPEREDTGEPVPPFKSRSFWTPPVMVLLSLILFSAGGLIYLQFSQFPRAGAPSGASEAPVKDKKVAPRETLESESIRRDDVEQEIPQQGVAAPALSNGSSRRGDEVSASPEKRVQKPSEVRRGQVVFATTPSGADIKINGDLMGVSPVSIDLPAGSHELLVSKKGYHALEATIDVPSGEKVPIHLKLLEEDLP